MLACPKGTDLNSYTNTCDEAALSVASFAAVFLIITLISAAGAVVASLVRTRLQNKTLDVIFAVGSVLECLTRWALLGTLFARTRPTGVFPIAITFMNIIATSSLGLFFNLLFMTPIYAHSAKFRHLWKQAHPTAFATVEWLSYIAGVNCMRLLSSNFLGLPGLNSDLNNYKFYQVPLNLVSNYTVIFTGVQLILDIVLVLELSPSDDAFALACLGLVLNSGLSILQLFKHLTTTRAHA